MPSIKKPKYVDDTIVEEEDNRTMKISKRSFIRRISRL